ncbi:hypothetical protein AAL_01766 [Moelleriella libera RCEF 2490]|uniref:Uncharacterized protein n=1 Tax=Moelleriella libera RCEF 2490 TaxID=1081109 RepID=A0A166UFB0_9HYPO|nr:hypothetical protein AAL_01766 [Moelleriella libera RCEF 2490]
MHFIVVAAALLGAASAAPDIGNRHSDSKCAAKRNNPVKLNKCNYVPASGSVTLYEDVKCTAYSSGGCRGTGRSVSGAKGCHSAKAWAQPKSFKCVAVGGAAGAAAADDDDDVDAAEIDEQE